MKKIYKELITLEDELQKGQIDVKRAFYHEKGSKEILQSEIISQCFNFCIFSLSVP